MAPKTIVITGCSPGGIGSALAREFRMRGHTVYASGRSPNGIDPALVTLGCRTLTLDVTVAQSIADAQATVAAATGGRLDVLINNAGVLSALPFADTPVDEARRVFEVNVLGVWAVTRAFLPLLLAARGIVANMGSVNDVFCPPFMAAYSASKAAVEAMGRCMRKELAPLRVRVVTLKTGSVRSSLFTNASPTLPEDSLYAPLKAWIEGQGYLGPARFQNADDYARQIVNDLLKDKVRAVVWRGGLTTVGWFLSWFGWETMLDGQMIKGNGLHKLRLADSA
ncbi:short-chain dehydrogenase/reductase [Diplogelasinospora grovesii]|uniref:Short-chain dehydrogenase/reductase n=1 Tax=Diplogelasinospora grovesii TaxID=303347 RepID=A0AAN6MZA0_9PEZI|nr:short-chain dehydrogenase/reductase [Diplogelasinospora grovesii]